MPEQTPINDQPIAGEETPEEIGSPISGKIKVLLFVVAVVVVECLIAYLYLPSSPETSALAEAALEANAQAEASQKQDEADEQEAGEQLEIDLGEFSVTAFQPVSNTTLRIDFHLFGTVALEDEKELFREIEDNQHRFREQVIVTIRSADISELTDAGLGLIKRKVLERSNRIFGKTLLRSIVFSDFSFIEQ